MVSVVEQNSLSSFHGMISSFHGMIPSYHDMISSYHAVFGLRHRDKSAKVIGLSGQTRGERDSTTGVFSPQTFTMTDANVCGGGCKRLRERLQCFASERDKTGAEIVSPILDERKDGSIRVTIAPRKILLSAEESVSHVVMSSWVC